MHDKAIADTEEYQLPAGSSCTQDRGFQGFTIPEVTMIQPLKKPRNRVLSPEERIENRAINQERIRIEHSIGSAKRYRIVKDINRSRNNWIRDMVMDGCCGLHNFRLMFRPFRYEQNNSA